MSRAHSFALTCLPFSVELPSQGYNGGSAPFPYATECTATAATATCDPETLVAEMDFLDAADPVALDITAATANGSDAVGPVNVAGDIRWCTWGFHSSFLGCSLQDCSALEAHGCSQPSTTSAPSCRPCLHSFYP